MAEFRVLGPVEAVVEGRPVPLAAAKPRALLALLLLNRNYAVPAGELIDGLWGDDPPETAAKALQGYVSQLRKSLGADRLETKAGGYVLRVDEGELDLDRFEKLVQTGRSLLDAGDAGTAAARLAEALALWRGPALAGFETEPFARVARSRLEDERLAALEDRLDAELALGRHSEVVPELEQLVAREPYRERPRGQLMVALYRSGRQADALDLYRRTRETLVDELGVEPGRELHELEQAILRQDESLERRSPARAVFAPAASKARRRWPLVAAAAAVVVAASVAALVLSRGSAKSSDRDLRAFTTKIENFLIQSREGRREIRSAIERLSRCKLDVRPTVVQLEAVQRNRQSILQQIASLSVPDDADAERSADRLQKAIAASIAADGRYREWLALHHHCGRLRPNRDFRTVLAADTRAAAAKVEFVRVFNPLARRLNQEVWTAGEL